MNIKEDLKMLQHKLGCVAVCHTPNTKYFYIYKAVMDFTNFLPINASFKDRVYYYLNDLKEIKKCKCGCGNNVLTPTRDYILGHSNRINSIKEKKVKAFLEKYGVTNPSQSTEIKTKKQQTFLEHYGQDHYMKSEHGRSSNENRILEKYGVKNVFQLPSIIEKIKKTRKNNEIETIKKRITTNRNKFLNDLISGNRLSNKFTPLFDTFEYEGVGHKKYKFKCTACNEITESTLDDGSIPRCYKCNPLINTKGQSISENELLEYIKTLVNNVVVQDRTVIKPLEVDIYLPDNKIAIEYDGLYWHSEIKGNKNHKYHLIKTNLCSDKHIHLIHVFEDEWNFKKSIVKNRLKNILGFTKYKIYARKCEIKEIDSKLKNKFLNKYHIQGEDRCVINLGLFYKNKLVSIMTFSKLRKALGQKHIEGYYELSRFCSINNFIIIGGASKLLSYFEKVYKPIMIKTYSDKRWNIGNLYYKLGFKLLHESRPNYWYIDKSYQKRYHRYSFNKQILKKRFENFNPNISEWKNMKANGYDRIWDCGTLTFEKYYN
jgi:hypothetical protein